MIEMFMIGMPLAMAALIGGVRGVKKVRLLLLATAVGHSAGTVLLSAGCGAGASGTLGEWIGADGLSKVFAGIVSGLFLCAAVHGFFWLPASEKFERREGRPMAVNVFAGALAAFAATMTMVIFARNFGLLWVAMEATTLASAPLIAFHRSRGAMEAMWKYLLICSVGIGLALFGTFLLEVAMRNPDGSSPGLNIAALSVPGRRVDGQWYKAAFVFCFAGYGLKMGLAPFHFWLPDAHSEAPSMVSLLLSGALLNCSFLALIRVAGTAPAFLADFCNEFFIGFGMVSLAAAACFMIRQGDFKRMLAYSSVEHMGLLAIAWGLGQQRMGMIHMGAHSVCKMLLFLTAGNILMAWGTRRVDRISGMFRLMPGNAVIWVAGILLICGMPPSPVFITEFFIVAAAGPLLGGFILVMLFTVFAAMTATALRMTAGEGDERLLNPGARTAAENLSFLPAVLAATVTAAGVFFIASAMGGIGL